VKTTIERRTVDLSQYPDLVVIYLGMRVNMRAHSSRRPRRPAVIVVSVIPAAPTPMTITGNAASERHICPEGVSRPSSDGPYTTRAATSVSPYAATKKASSGRRSTRPRSPPVLQVDARVREGVP
jgi:hypothetical protein